MENSNRNKGAETSEKIGGGGFHYSREERLSHPSLQKGTDAQSRKKQMNRRLMILFLDIILVTVVYLIYIFFLRPDPSAIDLPGYKVDIKAGYFAEQVLVRINVERKEEVSFPEILKIRVEDADQGILLAEDMDSIDPEGGANRQFFIEIEQVVENLKVIIESQNDIAEAKIELEEYLDNQN